MLETIPNPALRLYIGPRDFNAGVFTYLVQAGVDALLAISQMGGPAQMALNACSRQIAKVTRSTLVFSAKPLADAIGSVFDLELLICEVALRSGGVVILPLPSTLAWWSYVPFVGKDISPSLQRYSSLLENTRFTRSDVEVAFSLGLTPDQVASCIVSRMGLPR